MIKAFLLFCIVMVTSVNANAQWTYVSGRPTQSEIKNRWHYEIAVIDTVLYISADSKLMTSVNGIFWNNITGIPEYPYTGQYYSAGGLTPSKVFSGTGNGLYASTNSGANWTRVAFGFDGVCAVKNVKTLPGRIFISTCNGIYSSVNNGIFWTRLNNGIIGQSYPELTYVSDTLQIGISTYPEKYIYVSTNFGVNWTATPFNIPQPAEVYFGPSVYFKGKLYLSQNKWSTQGAPIYRTSNFGQTWDSVSSVRMTRNGINSFLAVNNDLLISTDSGVYRSPNEGYSWMDVSGNLKDSLGVTYLARYKNDIYAGHRMKGFFKAPVSQIVTVNNPGIESPESFSLSQNYPNPFNPVTEIAYTLPVASFITLRVFDILGKEIAVLVNEEKQPGKYSVFFDGSARALSTGVYFYKIEAQDFTQMRKMLLLK